MLLKSLSNIQINAGIIFTDSKIESHVDLGIFVEFQADSRSDCGLPMPEMLAVVFRCRSGIGKQNTAHETIWRNVESVFGFKKKHGIASIPVFLKSS